MIRILPAVLALCMVVLSAQKAFAWTHEFNTYPDIVTCGDYQINPCLYWPEPNGASTTIYAAYDGISSVGPTHYDFTSTLNNTFSIFNNVQGAFNPYMYECNYTGCHDAVHYTSGDLGDGTWAETDTQPDSYSTPQYGYGQWYAFFTSTTVTFNTRVSWNTNLQYSTTAPMQADARKVALHETGHVQGLGHTGYTAIMASGAEYFNPMTLQPNDINGLQTIYTGSITSTTSNG